MVAVAHREDDMAWQASLFSFFILGVEELLHIQILPPQQREGGAGIASADAQLLVQHGDVQPGRKALLHLSKQLQAASTG